VHVARCLLLPLRYSFQACLQFAAAATVMCCKERKENERKCIYIAPFVYHAYLKELRHGSHSFTCKYTMPAFPL